jgi:hypothetical protein
MATHWWKSSKLVTQLAEGSMREVDAVRYMAIAAFQYQVVLYMAAWYGNWRGSQLLVECLVVLAISLVGIHECYKANGSASGRQFLLRYCALSVPVALKLGLLSTAVGLAMSYGGGYVINRATFRDPNFVHEVLAFVLALVFTFAFYWRVAFHLSKVLQLERREASES